MVKQKWLVLGLIAILVLAIAGTASAAEFTGAEGVFLIESGEVVEDDLYVGAEEIIINGTVKGDLFAAASYIEINGTIDGDLFAAAAGIKVTGEVADDARLAAAGIDFSGAVGDDLFMAAGGQPGTMSFPMTISNNRTINQGIFLSNNARVGGDLYVGGGAGQIAGAVAGDAYIGMGAVTFGAQVDGNVELGTDAVTFGEAADIGGRLRISANSEPLVPNRLSERYEFNQIVQTQPEQPSTAAQIGTWVWRTAFALVGFVALSWLLLRFAPQMVEKPAEMLVEAPGRSAAYGLVAALGLMFIPLLSALVVALVWIFFGAGPGLALLAALFSVLSLMWIFSPLVTGYWIGKLFGLEALTGMLAGVAVIVVLMRLPFVGWLVALLSFLFAFGAILLLRFGPRGEKEPPLPVEKPIPAAG